jgi:hypothetical protein
MSDASHPKTHGKEDRQLGAVPAIGDAQSRGVNWRGKPGNRRRLNDALLIDGSCDSGGVGCSGLGKTG